MIRELTNIRYVVMYMYQFQYYIYLLVSDSSMKNEHFLNYEQELMMTLLVVHLLQYWLHLSEITDTDTRNNA